MYARRVNGKTLTFGVSGMLWQDSLVMYDAETRSLWSHLLGEAMDGPLKGSVLEQVPSVMTDWETWRARHPRTSVLNMSRTSVAYRRTFYRNPAQFVLGIAEGESAMAWRFDLLQRVAVLNDEFDGRPVVVFFDPNNKTARLFDRRVEGKPLRFTQTSDGFRDEQTGTLWDGVTGRAIRGPVSGKHLTPLMAIVSYTRAWTAFHPGSVIRKP